MAERDRGEGAGGSSGQPQATMAARAAAVAAVLHAGDRAPAVLARLRGGALAGAAAEAARLLRLDRSTRAVACAQVALLLTAAGPAGRDRIHPDWIEAALAGEGPEVRDIVEGRRAVDREVQVWLERRILGGLASMPSDEPDGPGGLPSWPSGALAAGLRRLGIAHLAWAVGRADRSEIGAMAARLGGADADAFVRAVAALAASDEGAEPDLGSRRAAAKRLSGLRFGSDPLASLAAGARALGGVLVEQPPELDRQIAQRLPMAEGSRVLAELSRARSAAAGNSAAAAPSAPARWRDIERRMRGG